jgi:hypothetical protein
MSLSQGFFRGPGISFSLCNTMKKMGPGLKRLRKGNLGALRKNPLEHFRISWWLLKRQGGGRVSVRFCLRVDFLACAAQFFHNFDLDLLCVVVIPSHIIKGLCGTLLELQEAVSDGVHENRNVLGMGEVL